MHEKNMPPHNKKAVVSDESLFDIYNDKILNANIISADYVYKLYMRGCVKFEIYLPLQKL